MKRIEYENVKNCEREYLKALGFLDEKEEFTETYNSLNNSWEIIRGNKDFSSLLSLPEDVKDLLICPYEKLICYFILLLKLKKEDYQKLKEIFDNNEFNYEKFRDKIATFFKDNADKLKIHSCFYCDAAYTGVFLTRKSRQTFDVDHFFPKSEYPMFSLSLYNFVPSCQVCNSRIKGDKFIELFSLEQKLLSKNGLLQISPASKKYDMDSNLTIKVYPQKQDKNSDKKEQKIDNEFNQVNQNEGSETDNEWHYTSVFSKNLENYRVIFDVNGETAYEKVVKSFLLEERYNNIAIKSQALYLMDLKKKYPDSNIKFLSSIINQNAFDKNKRDLISPEKIKKSIFHKDNKYALLQKLRNDIIDYDIFDEV